MAPAKGMASLGGSLVSGLGKLGMAGLGMGVVADSAKGLAGALGVGLNSELEMLRSQFIAITKDAAGTDKMLASFQTRADKTPFGLTEVAKAGAMLLPISKQLKTSLDPLLDTASMLAALNPTEGLEGAAFALREALSGDFVSLQERFNIPREAIKRLKAQGLPPLKIVNAVLKEMGIDMSLVTAMGETFQGRLSTLDDTIKGFRRTLSAPLFAVLKDGIIEVQGILDRNKDAINAWATVWGKRIGDVARVVIFGVIGMVKELRALSDFIKSGNLFEDSAFFKFKDALNVARDAALTFSGAIKGEWGGMVNDDIHPAVRAFGMFGLAINKAIGFVAPFIPAIQDLGKAIANIVKGNAGIDLFISEFKRLFGIDISGVIGRFQMVFTQIGQIIKDVSEGDISGAVNGLLDLIVGTRLDLIEAVGSWAAAFINWLTPHIPAILNGVAQVVLAIGNWIETRGPEIQARLMSWVAAFTNWVAPMIPPLLTKLGELVGVVANWIAVNGPIFLEQFITTWLPAFTNWLADAGIALLPHLTTFLGSLKEWVKANAAPMTQAFIAHWVPIFIGWLAEAAVQIVPALVKWQAEIVSWIATKGVPAFFQMGIDLGGAIIMGIIQALNGVKDKMREALIAAGIPLPGQGLVPAVPPGVTQRPPVPPGMTERPPVPPAPDPATQAQMIAIKTELLGVTEALRAHKIAVTEATLASGQLAPTMKKAAAHLLGPY